MIINERIKQRRVDVGMTQEELAKKTGYTDKSTICKIETGNVNIPYKKILLFAEVLNTTPSWLMGWDTADKSPEKIAEEDKVLLEAYHRASPELQEVIQRILKDK